MAGATFNLSRRWGGIDRNDWTIEIDGKVVGSIAYQDSVDLPIEPGHHTLRIVGKGKRLSPVQAFDAGDGTVVRFWCRSALIWPIMVAALVKNDLWITLKRA
jgi:hypothetical protein